MPNQSKLRRRDDEMTESFDQSKRIKWRPWRPSSSSSDELTSDSENDMYKRRKYRGKTVPYKSDIVTARSEVIPLFDPDKLELFASQWLNKIEQLGAVHNWTSDMKSYFMQSRLAGSARIWHTSLQNYEFTWPQWKEKLLEAFPRNIDYVESLREMLSRKKHVSESMTQYYYSKNALLTRLDITGEKAVACIIDGLPNFMKAPARAGNYQTPENLYSKFLSTMEDVKPKPLQIRHHVNTETRTDVQNTEFKKYVCFLCQEPGHTVRRCPKNIQSQNKTLCTHCSKPGHPSEKCWFKSSGPATVGASTSTNTKKTTVHVVGEQVNDTYFKTIDVNNIGACAYFDTGARINVANQDFFQKLNLPLQRCDLIVGGFGGTPVPAKGLVSVTLNIDDLTFDTQLVVTDWHMKGMDIIIGQPIINEPSIEFMISGNTLKLRKKVELPLDTVTEKPTKHEVKCKSDVTIPPKNVFLVEVLTEAASEETLYIESSRRLFKNVDYAIPSCVIKGEECILEVTNSSQFPLLLKEGQLLTRAHVCTTKEIPYRQAGDTQDILESKVMKIDISKLDSR